MFKLLLVSLLSLTMLGQEAEVASEKGSTMETKYETLNEDLTKISNESSYQHGIGNGEYHETEITQAIKEIKSIINDDTLTKKEQISNLYQLASNSSYEYGVGNGEYHETEVSKLVFEVIEKLK